MADPDPKAAPLSSSATHADAPSNLQSTQTFALLTSSWLAGLLARQALGSHSLQFLCLPVESVAQMVHFILQLAAVAAVAICLPMTAAASANTGCCHCCCRTACRIEQGEPAAVDGL
jgi:predicted lipid-binding transport protein (Tim44 family)